MASPGNAENRIWDKTSSKDKGKPTSETQITDRRAAIPKLCAESHMALDYTPRGTEGYCQFLRKTQKYLSGIKLMSTIRIFGSNDLIEILDISLPQDTLKKLLRF